jgi:hypothetical protein
MHRLRYFIFRVIANLWGYKEYTIHYFNVWAKSQKEAEQIYLKTAWGDSLSKHLPKWMRKIRGY